MANSNSITISKASNQYATTPDATDLNFGSGPFSVECWFKRNSKGVTMGLLSKIDTDSTGWRLAFGSDDTLSFNCYNGTNTDIVSSVTAFSTLGVWHHVAVERTGTNLIIFIDTVQEATGTDNSRNVSNTNVPFAIGPLRSGDLGNSSVDFDGLIDEVRLWNTNISQNNSIIPNWKRELGGNEANLVAYYKLNNSYNDQTGLGHTLTANGIPSFTTDVPFTDNTTTSTSTTSTSSSTTTTTSTSSSSSTSTSTTSTSTSTTSTSTSRTTSTSKSTSTSTTSTVTTTSTTTTSTSTTTTSTSTTSTSSSTSSSISTSTSTTITLNLKIIVEKVK